MDGRHRPGERDRAGRRHLVASAATTTVATSTSDPTATCTSRSATPGPTLGKTAASTPRATCRCSTARSCASRSTASRRPATRCRVPAPSAARRAATCRRRRRRAARSCSPGVCATRSGSRSTPTVEATGSSSTTSGRAPSRRSTRAVSVATTAGTSARGSADGGPPAGITDPLTDYPRSVGTVITGGAFVPDGLWPADLDGGYLFADGGSGSIFLRRANGTVDYATPWATGAGGIADMVFAFDEAGRTALYYTLNGNGQLRKIVWNGQVASPTPSNLAFVRDRADARLRHPLPGSASSPATCAPTRPVWSTCRRRLRRCRLRSSTSRSRTTPAGGSWRPGRRVRCARPPRWSTSCSRVRTSPTPRSSRSTTRAGSCSTRRWPPTSSSTSSAGSRRRQARRPPDASCRSIPVA